jgi:hypothetical protein
MEPWNKKNQTKSKLTKIKLTKPNFTLEPTCTPQRKHEENKRE